MWALIVYQFYIKELTRLIANIAKNMQVCGKLDKIRSNNKLHTSNTRRYGGRLLSRNNVMVGHYLLSVTITQRFKHFETLKHQLGLKKNEKISPILVKNITSNKLSTNRHHSFVCCLSKVKICVTTPCCQIYVNVFVL